MVDDCDRESQLSGCAARVQQGRKNINGSGVVILVALKMGKLFRSPDEPRPLGEEVGTGMTVYAEPCPTNSGDRLTNGLQLGIAFEIAL